MHVTPDPGTLAQGDQIQAQLTEQLKYMRMFYDGTRRQDGDYVGTGKVFVKLRDDEESLSRSSLVMLFMEAMRQLNAAGVPVDGPGGDPR